MVAAPHGDGVNQRPIAPLKPDALGVRLLLGNRTDRCWWFQA
jgi:hypothetical protein